jgi:hypothetical protein
VKALHACRPFDLKPPLKPVQQGQASKIRTYWRSCGYREGRRERDSAAAEVNHGHECTG